MEYESAYISDYNVKCLLTVEKDFWNKVIMGKNSVVESHLI